MPACAAHLALNPTQILHFQAVASAASDFDGDGDIDLLFVGGNTEPNHLYENQGDGTLMAVDADQLLTINQE